MARQVNSRYEPALEEIQRVQRRGRLGSTLVRFITKKPLGAFSAGIILLLVLVAASAPIISPYDPVKQNLYLSLDPPSRTHILGTDRNGRDILSNIIWGARISIYVGFMAVGLGTLSGSIVGIISGYLGSKTDFVIQRLVDTFMALPTLILLLVTVVVLGQSITNVMLAITISIMPGVSRVVRGTTLSVKENQYVDAARAIGCGNLRIMALHVLPNVMAPIIILASIGLGGAVLAEASLSFLGLGTPPPTPSWGRMLSGQNLQYMVHAPWLLIAPGLAITLVVLSFNLLGDALRDVMDPRLRGT